MHRVKLYKLNQQGLWDDKGTGHVGIEFLPVRLRRECSEHSGPNGPLRSGSLVHV